MLKSDKTSFQSVELASHLCTVWPCDISHRCLFQPRCELSGLPPATGSLRRSTRRKTRKESGGVTDSGDLEHSVREDMVDKHRIMRHSGPSIHPSAHPSVRTSALRLVQSTKSELETASRDLSEESVLQRFTAVQYLSSPAVIYIPSKVSRCRSASVRKRC